MNPKVELSAHLVPELSGVHRLLADELDGVSGLIGETLEHEFSAIREILVHSARLSGKRLRPILLLLAAKATGGIRPEHLQCAAAVELIHTATLIHDDILDGAAIRRHLKTINLRWNTQVAVLAGDYLLTQAIRLIAKTKNIDCYEMVAEACRQTCEGELLQTTLRGRFDLTESEYFQIITGKTASLLEIACQFGPFWNLPKKSHIAVFGKFGQNVGAAFQILDDILDLVGRSDAMGKTLGTDLANQKPTLPLIYFLREASPALRASVVATLESPNRSDAELTQIAEWIEESGGIAAARETATRQISEGLAALNEVKNEADSSEAAEAFAALGTVAEFVLARNR